MDGCIREQFTQTRQQYYSGLVYNAKNKDEVINALLWLVTEQTLFIQYKGFLQEQLDFNSQLALHKCDLCPKRDTTWNTRQGNTRQGNT